MSSYQNVLISSLFTLLAKHSNCRSLKCCIKLDTISKFVDSDEFQKFSSFFELADYKREVKCSLKYVLISSNNIQNKITLLYITAVKIRNIQFTRFLDFKTKLW